MFKIGHRGAKGHEPENTIIGFQKAIDLHVDRIELDVHLSSDNELMVIHDETIDRTTDGQGLVTSFSLPELKRFKIEKIHNIPTLTEVLNLIDQKCDINIELKSFESADYVVTLIEKYVNEKNWKYDRFVVSSFDWNVLQQVAFLNADIPIGVLTETDLDLALAFAKFIRAKSIHPYFHLLTKENTAQLQQKGFQVFPWTINEIEDIKRIKTYQVDGIISDFPDRL
ncbi:glycerophosphodiester phosphodiesterase [Flavobacterium muglaense]|uniref:Glycerophosphodiester phosphodiesterase n=1 Tax=Flavobacterium muglaense TaxID=2764716 RepID=A0A923N0F1_9FLAO|nr:glycerophosphodiester phosphodiesterase family protein [Flavobacterium muglaense]MBC5836899.1 glycerophosphodiester phosphodiesterase [Flavobacterium muglaense]MBC5843428.1 glycerophosphodiester phosphodiesterase [Flavobacterium muglaense]